MSILIKVMEMPKGELGSVHVVIFEDGAVCHFFTHEKLGNAFDELYKQKIAEVVKPATNYDRIISKTPEEMAEWIAGDVLNLTGGALKMATEAWADWLRKEGE